MNNTIYGKRMENFRNRIDVRLVSNKNDYLKWTSKSNYMSQKIFDNNLFPIRESKITLELKPPYFRMFMLDLSKVLMYIFLYDNIKNKYATTKDYYLLTRIV